MPHTFLPAAVPSVEVNFNDTRCADGGRVCPTDSLLFTCTGNEIFTLSLRVTLPSGNVLALNNDGTLSGIGSLSDGFSVESSSVAVNDGGISFNYALSLSIDDAALLAGGMIVCDDSTPANREMAGCPTAGMFYHITHSYAIHIIIIIIDIFLVCESIIGIVLIVTAPLRLVSKNSCGPLITKT